MGSTTPAVIAMQTPRTFSRVLIANRGAIACRIARTLRSMGLTSVGVYSDADRGSAHVDALDIAIHMPGDRAAVTYLNAEALIEIARTNAVGAIHPGYGFLAENPAFAEACEAAGIVFLGPRPDSMRAFGLKDSARMLAEFMEVPVLTGSAVLPDVDSAVAAAARIGYPVMLKSTAGGGGIGMQVCADEASLRPAFASVTRLAQSSFGDAGVILERYVADARHIEVQLFGQGDGRVCVLGDRDCSLQRRNQKVVEEAPAPGLSASLRAEMHAAARRLLAGVRYRSAGTAEFLYDAQSETFYFLEVNARLQVEHGVTELVTGVDIVEWMLRLELGTLGDRADVDPCTQGVAIQARIYAEDPLADFRPSTGLVTRADWAVPAHGRIDTWVRPGVQVSAHYDPMLAKVLVHAGTRDAAITQLQSVLQHSRIDGLQTNRRWLVGVLALAQFRAVQHSTRTLANAAIEESAIEVLDAGTFTTVQSWPGRMGYWDVGVPPSGPMDALSFRLGNRLLGNATDCSGLEFTALGGTLRFRSAARVVLTGADFAACVDEAPVPRWIALQVRAGQTLKLNAVRGGGMRGYLLVQGGIDVPDYLGSAATFTLGAFGGHAGRALRVGDVLPLVVLAPTPGEPPVDVLRAATAAPAPSNLASVLQPVMRDDWTLRVLIGPHAAPDFITERGIDELLAAHWEVHFQSSRTGVRLMGPKPDWARTDGGDAGLHPSNLHDNAYAIGAVDFTGDMPVILGPDGPSLGGFVCPFTVIAADQWMLGQLRAGDRVQFLPVTAEDALQLLARQSTSIAFLQPETGAAPRQRGWQRNGAVLSSIGEGDELLVARASGECNLLLEVGPAELDLRQRLRIERLQRALLDVAPAGMQELTAGVRSLQVHFDPQRVSRSKLLGLIRELDVDARRSSDVSVSARIVHLPLSWDDPAVQLAIERYTRVVRADAPWCPSNIEFIRRINGLADEAAVRRIVFDASYLVLALGDVYLGAPVATPMDPRHRLVTTKYNPARTWTPENAVGIGGAYLCVYGMEGPGGYQFVGRTVQMWNRFPHGRPPASRTQITNNATSSDLWTQPWLLRTFDQIRFYPVDAQELLEMRAAFPHGRYVPRVDPAVFRLATYEATLRDNAESIAQFRATQRTAFAAERDRWRVQDEQDAQRVAAAPRGAATQQSNALGPSAGAMSFAASEVPDGAVRVLADVAGVVAAVDAKVGDTVLAGARLCVIESMKMEIPVLMLNSGNLRGLLVQPGDAVHAGQLLAWFDAA